MNKTEIAQKMIDCGCNKAQLEYVLDCRVNIGSYVKVTLIKKDSYGAFGEVDILMNNLPEFKGEKK